MTAATQDVTLGGCYVRRPSTVNLWNVSKNSGSSSSSLYITKYSAATTGPLYVGDASCAKGAAVAVLGSSTSSTSSSSRGGIGRLLWNTGTQQLELEGCAGLCAGDGSASELIALSCDDQRAHGWAMLDAV